MSIITLTTDYGLKDHFVGVIKGKLFLENSEATIIDISHDIDSFNIMEASYLIGCAYINFPKGTIHIIGVDIEKNIENQHLVMLWSDQYFICADNGILSLLTQKTKPQKIISINIHENLTNNQNDIDAFIKVANHIYKGGQLHEIGAEITQIKEINELKPIVKDDLNSIKGFIIYIDHFGNVVTNITKKKFEDIGKSRKFEIILNEQSKHNAKENITHIYNKYSDIASKGTYDLKTYDGIKVAIFNENGYLEIGIFKSNNRTVGSAKSLFGLNYRDTILINFS